MRKTFLLPLILWATMLSLFSCKKETIAVDTPQSSANEKLIPIIKSWLDQQKKELPSASLARVEALELNLSYGEIRVEKYKESKELIVIPVLDGFNSRNNSDKNPVNYLVLVFENQDSITRGNIIQYISSNGPKAVPRNSFSKIFTYQDLDCSGQFTILSITDNFRFELKFVDGKLRSVAEPSSKTNPNSNSGRVNDCIDWYLQTWYIWSDGTVELFSEVYVYTTCDGDCAQLRIANGRSYGTSCNGGGGGGGNGVEFEYPISKPLIWDVQTSVYWRVTSNETVSGLKKASEPQGGHFTSIVHGSSYLTRDDNHEYTWEELTNTMSVDNPQTVSAYVTGRLTRTTGTVYIYNGHTTRSFATVFP